jgi:FkbM family methyltransferase
VRPANEKTINFGWATVRMLGNADDDYFKNLDNYLNGSPELWYYVGNHLADDAIIFDCGANIGATALMMATRCPKGHVYAFEAGPTNAGILRRNIALNNIRNVTVIDGPLGYDLRKVRFHESHFGAGSHIKSAEGIPHPEATTIELSTNTLDRFINSPAFRHDKVDFIKMDVEGYEPAVLLGARSLVAKFAPPIFMEINTFTIAFAHRFDPLAFIEFLWKQFDVKRVTFGGSISNAEDLAGFVYANMIQHQCVDDVLLLPKPKTSFDQLERVVQRGSPRPAKAATITTWLRGLIPSTARN